MGAYILIILKSGMNHSSLIRVHWFQRYRLSGSLHLLGDILCQILQGRLSALPIILCIHLYADVILSVLIDHQAGKILQRIQCLASLADQNAHICAVQCNIHLSVLPDFE